MLFWARQVLGGDLLEKSLGPRVMGAYSSSFGGQAFDAPPIKLHAKVVYTSVFVCDEGNGCQEIMKSTSVMSFRRLCGYCVRGDKVLGRTGRG